MKSSIWLSMIVLMGLLTACGGGGGSDDPVVADSADTTSIIAGVAVDPYITGAQFEELSADEQTLIQGSAGTSSATGQFAFNEPINVGSIIRINLNSKGQHAGVPYTGVIKRQVFAGDEDPIIVSPLTTLLANGMSPDAVLQMLNQAGLSGLTGSDLKKDPMAALATKTGDVTESDLVLLQSNMAVNAFMEATKNFNYGGPSPAADSPVSFSDIAAMVQESCNPVLYRQLASAISTDFTVGDMAHMAVVITKEAVRQVNSGSAINSVTTIDNDLANAINIADGFYQTRTGMGSGMPDPGTGGMTDPGTGGTTDPGTGGMTDPGTGGTTDPGTGGMTDPGTGGTADPGTGGGTTPSTPDGQAIYIGATGATCSLCHTVGTTDTSYRELAGDGAKITTRFGGGAAHNGNTLTADEITAIATYFDSQGGTTIPGTGGTADPGTGGMTDPGTGGTADPGTGTGGTTDPGTGGGTTPSTPDGQALVNSDCIGCHNVGQGGTMDLSGKGDAAYGNITSGHQGISMTDPQANAVADYLDTLTPASDPAVFVHPYFSDAERNHRNYVNDNGTNNCVSCHAADLRGSGQAPSCYSCHGQKW
jgi:mono/diheme cytochrome c family protein